MPTNKLWIEHTERAAWESVQALREKLAEAERRLQKLAPPVDGWPALLALVEAASAHHGLSADTHAETLRLLLERLAQAEAQLSSLAEQDRLVAGTLKPAPEHRPPARLFDPDVSSFDDDDDDDDAEEGERSASTRFLRAVERGYRATRLTLPSGLEALLAAIETQVDELADSEESALDEGAVRLAILAARLERAARRSRRPAPPRDLSDD
ncbi:MAG TPA: hypothetical protein VER33_03455 [Polyangiaceae bacterium]|nr:hypothetical protein [Polyangiaceae bacterium]